MTKSGNQPLKIGFVLDGGLEEPDGVQQYILTLGDYYKSLGHTIRYIVAGKINYGKEDAVSLNSSIGVRSNGNKLSVPILPPSRKKLKRFLKEEQLDVLHVQAPYSPVLAEQLVFLADKRTAIIGTFHVVPHYWFLDVGNYLLGLWCRFSIKRFDAIVSVSEAAHRVTKRDFGVDSDIVPNVVDFDRFKKAKPLASKDKKLTILFLGRLVERKGCLELLKAVSLIANKANVPKFKVVICGKGPLLNQLKAFVKQKELSEVVEFKGFVSEKLKPRYYASADISVFPALGGESFGIVLLEAMASGKSAVIAADNEGYVTVLKAYPKQLFAKKDPLVLAEKLEELLKKKSVRLEYAKSGSVYAAQFDVKVVGNRLLNIYSEALRKKRG